MPGNVKRCWDKKKTIKHFSQILSWGEKNKKNVGGIVREFLGGGEVSGHRDGVNEEPLQEAAGRLLVDLEPGDSIVGGSGVGGN